MALVVGADATVWVETSQAGTTGPEHSPTEHKGIPSRVNLCWPQLDSVRSLIRFK